MNYYTTSFKKRAAVYANTANTNAIEQLVEKHFDTPTVTHMETQTSISTERYQKLSPKINKGIQRVTDRLDRALQLYPSSTKKDHFSFFEIPKATGGVRKISAPSEELKEHYLRIRNDIREQMLVLAHNRAYAYIKGRSTKDALRRHQENSSNYFLKIDISQFFDNCSPELIIKQLSKVYPFYHNPDLIKKLAEFATLENGLPQGTPLSPDLTNWIMVPFDAHFDQWCKNLGYIYTRYADDIIVSHKDPFKFTQVIQTIEDLFATHEYPFLIKKKKTRYGSKAGSNWNLGLMLNKDNQITVGHKLKKNLKTIIFKTANGEIESGNETLLGMLAYLKQIEPGYYTMLNSYCIDKYRLDINEIMS